MKYTDKNQLIRDWYTALKSGKYRQFKDGGLRAGINSDDYSYCCLGVLANIGETRDVCKSGGWLWENGDIYPLFKTMDLTLRVPLSLQHKTKGNSCAWASVLNDTYKLTFDEIAECVKETWPEAFTETLASLTRELGPCDGSCCGPNGCSV